MLFTQLILILITIMMYFFRPVCCNDPQNIIHDLLQVDKYDKTERPLEDSGEKPSLMWHGWPHTRPHTSWSHTPPHKLVRQLLDPHKYDKTLRPFSRPGEIL